MKRKEKSRKIYFILLFLIKLKKSPMSSSQYITIFAQGVCSPRSQASKYVGEKGIQVPTLDTVARAKEAPLLLHNLWNYPEIDEIGYKFSANPIHWTFLAGTFIKNWWEQIDAPHYYVNLDKVQVAGKQNVNSFIETIRECSKANPKKKLILFGTSRGAATVFVSMTKIPKDLLTCIALVILEGIPDSLEKALEVRYFFTRFAFKNLSGHDFSDPNPIDVVKDYPVHVPTAFICSEADRTCPKECTDRLVSALEKMGGVPRRLILKEAPHRDYPRGNQEDTKSYLSFMKKLYEFYCSD
jgi:hypothetical protein